MDFLFKPLLGDGVTSILVLIWLFFGLIIVSAVEERVDGGQEEAGGEDHVHLERLSRVLRP